MIQFSYDEKQLRLSVRDMVTDRGSEGQIYLPGRGQLGQKAHQKIQDQQQQSDSYRAEVSLKQQLQVTGFNITLYGRLDGLHAGPPPLVEEIKSVILPDSTNLAHPDLLRPAWVQQLQMYCWMLARQENLKEVRGELVLINLLQGDIQRQQIPINLPEIESDLQERLARLLQELVRKEKHWEQRSRQTLPFPFGHLRPGQETLMQQVDQVIRDESLLLLSAPTGSGKTIGTLYPSLQRALKQRLRLFVATAKNSGQDAFTQTLQLLVEQGAPVNGVVIPARRGICLHTTYACESEFCPYLQDFDAKLLSALRHLEATAVVTRQDLLTAGELLRVCPHEVALRLSEERDVIIGDYNHAFSPSSQIRRLFREREYNDLILLLDEAHHFPDRNRDYYSQVIRVSELEDGIRHLQQLTAAHTETTPDLFNRQRPLARMQKVISQLALRLRQIDYGRTDRWTWENSRSATFPADELSEIGLQLAEQWLMYLLELKAQRRAAPDDVLTDLYFNLQHFINLSAETGTEFEQYVQETRNDLELHILCLETPRRTREQLAGFHSGVLLSATLPPFAAYQTLLHLDPDTPTLQLPSPFPQKNRLVLIRSDLLTTWTRRERELPRIVQAVQELLPLARGNMAVYFPSFQLMRQAAELFSPEFRLLLQPEEMTVHEKQNILAQLAGSEQVLLLAVSGGSLAEGVDFRGNLLKAVVVIGPALPSIRVDNELIRRYHEQQERPGFDFAYKIPGLGKVAQAAGRLIRGADETGILLLIGRRFNHPDYQKFLPDDLVQQAHEVANNAEMIRKIGEWNES